MPSAHVQEHIVFEDNRLVPVLYGEQNAHLKKIESALQVEIGDRGNELTISGRPAQAESARAVLEALWKRLKDGHAVGAAEVDAALRFLKENPGGGHDVNGFDARNGSIVTRKKRINARTPVQAEYVKALQTNRLVFGMGPAGTGKTYLAVARAVELMESGKVERIILSRPAVEAGERIGFLPGEMKEKMDPYMRPLYDALHDLMAGERVEKKLLSEEIEIGPLAFMRGRTLNNAYVILDEAQNTTAMQMLMFLTRLGENSYMAVTGDPGQIDLPQGVRSGLLDAADILPGVEDVAFVRFGHKDVVRSKMVERIIQAYEARNRYP